MSDDGSDNEDDYDGVDDAGKTIRHRNTDDVSNVYACCLVLAKNEMVQGASMTTADQHTFMKDRVMIFATTIQKSIDGVTDEVKEKVISCANKDIGRKMLNKAGYVTTITNEFNPRWKDDLPAGVQIDEFLLTIKVAVHEDAEIKRKVELDKKGKEFVKKNFDDAKFRKIEWMTFLKLGLPSGRDNCLKILLSPPRTSGPDGKPPQYPSNKRTHGNITSGEVEANMAKQTDSENRGRKTRKDEDRNFALQIQDYKTTRNEKMDSLRLVLAAENHTLQNQYALDRLKLFDDIKLAKEFQEDAVVRSALAKYKAFTDTPFVPKVFDVSMLPAELQKEAPMSRATSFDNGSKSPMPSTVRGLSIASGSNNGRRSPSLSSIASENIGSVVDDEDYEE